VEDINLLLKSSDLSLDEENLIGSESTLGKGGLELINLSLLLSNSKNDALSPLLESSLAGKALLNANNGSLSLEELLAELLKLRLTQARLKKSSLHLVESLLSGLELSLETSTTFLTR